MCARRLCFVLTIDDYNARAKDMGWTFKDEVPEVGGTKVNWECNHGHPVYSSYHTVKRCLLYTSPSPRDKRQSRMPSSA